MPFSQKEGPPMPKYIVSSSRAEPRRGARFTSEEAFAAEGVLCLFEIKTRLIIGRRFEDWIIQPDRWIFIGETVVECLGRIVLLLAI
jgi:hypothetical protein